MRCCGTSRSRRSGGPSFNRAEGRHPEVPWRRPADLRNRIVHSYWSIDLEILHTTATEQLGPLIMALHAVLDELT
ncbi:HepT-like ribonuclease domain-containing protein [Amycolatopsis taiwanensis]|uniref:HepT-like ribonuclease domain-containing protein n=1 Tax=Amycolatopsis taiwanensis TaxID=342230 RepID=UPI003CCBD7B9